jgi:hypothetical protein
LVDWIFSEGKSIPNYLPVFPFLNPEFLHVNHITILFSFEFSFPNNVPGVYQTVLNSLQSLQHEVDQMEQKIPRIHPSPPPLIYQSIIHLSGCCWCANTENHFMILNTPLSLLHSPLCYLNMSIHDKWLWWIIGARHNCPWSFCWTAINERKWVLIWMLEILMKHKDISP